MSFNFAPVVNDPRTPHITRTAVASGLPDSNDAGGTYEPARQGQMAAGGATGFHSHQPHLAALVGAENAHGSDHDHDETDASSDEEFYTPGPPELRDTREFLLAFSVARARARTAMERDHATRHNFTKELRHRRGIAANTSRFGLHGSYTLAGTQRALNRVRYNSTGDSLACALWDGSFALLHKDNTGFYREAHRLAPGCHVQMATVDWSPADARVLASGGGEGQLNVWRAPGGPAAEELVPEAAIKSAHGARIALVAFHPLGNFLATASHDQTWKLWDVRRPEHEVFEQEGHAGGVHSVAVHTDGALVVSGGLDAHALLWDLRSGRKIGTLEGHAKGIYATALSPNGRHVATGGGDNAVKIWDLRMGGEELFSIPAHSKLVSDVRFIGAASGTQNEKGLFGSPVVDENGANAEALSVSGTCLVSSSYDGTVKVWSADNWVPLVTLKGHTDRVISCDIRADGGEIVSCGWDRSLRAWTMGDEEVGA